MSDKSCNSRPFTWLTKTCCPNPQQQHDNIHHPCPISTTTATILSLPDDILLECLSRVPHSSLSSLSFVCRRWSYLVDTTTFYNLRRSSGYLHHTVFAVSVTDSGLYTSTCAFGKDTSWKKTSLLDHCVPVCFQPLLSQARLVAIGRMFYIIARTAMIQCDTWTGVVTPHPAMVFPRKKFAAAGVSGKVYIAGGVSTLTVEEYNPETSIWSVVAEAPRKRYGCIGASVDGVFYVIGGLKMGASRVAGAEAHVYASSMDLYDVEARGWLRSRAVPGGGCVVAACAAGGNIFILASHTVELSFWKFNACRKSNNGFGEWSRLKSPPLPAQVRVDSTVRFSCVGIGENVCLIQVMGCIDDLLRRSGRNSRGLKEGLVLIYDSSAGEWSRGPDLPEFIRRAACVSVEC